jgi:hypothetical protein
MPIIWSILITYSPKAGALGYENILMATIKKPELFLEYSSYENNLIIHRKEYSKNP